MSSGSKGNSLYVEGENTRILIDAGIGARSLSNRLAQFDTTLDDIDALFISHEHSDHVRGVGTLAKKFKIPVYCTEGTFRKARQSYGLTTGWRRISQQDNIEVNNLMVESYPTPHDAAESVAFVVRCGKKKLGHATDLGSVPLLVKEKLKNSDTLLVEANHDIPMLKEGAYPWHLKQRILGSHGHLSNEDCAELLASVEHPNLKKIVLMHLSETNNHPQKAISTVRHSLSDKSIPLILANQNEATPLMDVG